MTALPTNNLGMGDAKMPSGNHADAHAQADADAGHTPNLSNDKSMPIAIIGMGFRGPADATDVNGLWKMILEGREGFSPIPQKRWNNAAFYHPDHARHGTINVHGGHFISEDIDLFDAPFFNMTSDEAAAMDPQQRLLLEVTYEALESGKFIVSPAGIPLQNITGSRTSCFVGSFNADYTDMLLRDPEFVPMYQCTNAGQSRAMTANRVSYFFDFKGPSVTVDTACSGSLVGLHLACQSLQSGDANMAVAAGVNLILSHEFMTTMSMMKFLSPDGRCRTFDENANGYARGEAIGCLLLKPLKDAIRDNDTIRAVIRGTGSNQDGRTPGITLPSGTAQETLIRHVYHSAGLDPRETEFVETHGTGTQAGDPIETGALSKVLNPDRPRDSPLRIGSIKSNVGHLEGTSGVAGVIKAVLMLENKIFLPNRNLKTINPRIPLEEWNLKVQLTPEPWESEGPHRISVNSFGYGGSNAHVILEDIQGYTSTRNMTVVPRKSRQSLGLDNINEKSTDSPFKQAPGRRTRIYTLSGFDEASCKNQVQRLREYVLEKQNNIDECFMDNLAFSLNERRTNFAWKAAIIGDSTANVAEALAANVKPKRAGKIPSIGFVFTGQGAQWSGMGKELLGAYPVFRESMNRSNLHLAKIGAPFSIEEEILRSKETSRLSHPLLSQPICSALQIALVDLLYSWGIFPDSVTGHSSGEIAAAYAIGAISLEDAMSVAYYRGAAASKLQALTDGHGRGGMMAVGMSAEDAQPYLNNLESGKAVVACVNSPSSVTISGDLAAIEELEKVLNEKQVFYRHLAVEVAYHSHHMKAVAREYFASIASITPRSQTNARSNRKTMLFFSSVTGKEAKAPELGPQYWVSNLLNQVKFSDSVNALCFETGSIKNVPGGASKKRQKRAGAARKANIDFLIEIGPHSALAAPIKQILKADPKLDAAEIVYSTVLARSKDAVSSTLILAAALATAGYSSLDFAAINRPIDAGHRQEMQLLVDLPTYAWNHSRSYWAESRVSKMYRNREYPRTDLLGVPDRMACPFEPRWRNYLRISEIPWLEDHKIQSNIVYPAAGYITMAIEASFQHILGNKADRNVAGYHLRDISIQSALVISETSAAEVMVSLQSSEPGHSDSPETEYQFRVYSVSEDNRWTEHCKGFIGVEYVKSNNETTILERLEDSVKFDFEAGMSDLHDVDIQQFYEKLGAVGLEYGHCFANLTAANLAGDACIAEVINPDTASVMPVNFQHPVLIHPCTLDSVFHTIFVGMSENMDSDDEPPIPVSIDKLYISQSINSEPGHKMGIRTSVRNGGRRGDIVASILVSDSSDAQSNNGGPVVCISGLTCRSLARDFESSKTKQRNRIAYALEWKPDPDLLSAKNASKLLIPVGYSSDHQQAQGPEERDDLYERCAIYYIKKALKTIDTAGPTKLEPHISKQLSIFVEVNRQYKDTGEEGFPVERVKTSGAKGDLLCAVGEELPALLKEEVNIFTVTQNQGRLETYREDMLHSTRGYETACRYLDMVSHKDPMISVLEVGAGTGRSSLKFLEQLSAHNSGIPRCREYTIANPDPSVFESAAQRLASWANWYSFKQLNIEGDLEAQSFQSDLYDVVIVPYGIYTASSVKKVLSNIRALMKPGGHFLLVDPVSKENSLVERMIFGSFSGSLEDSTYGLSQAQWNDILLDAQFTGVEAFVECKDREFSSGCSIILSRAPRQTPSLDTDVLIVTEESNSGVSAKHLQALLSHTGLNSEITKFADANPAGRTCIVLSELHSSVLAYPDDRTFKTLKQVFLQSAGVLWVSRGGTVLTATNPDASLVAGFARTIRSESGVDPIVTLDLDCNNHLSDEQAARVILDLVNYRFLRKSAGSDTEFAERDGILCIPRVVECSQLNETITALQDNHSVSDHIFDQADRPLRATAGDGDTDDESVLVRFTNDPRIADLPPGYVRIQVKAVGLNEQDVQVVTRQAQQGILLGSECSGIVHSIGDGVDGFAVGDRVACLGSGTAVNVYQDHASAFQKLPDDMPFDMAAALPVAYSTGFHVVHHLARITSDDSVLIHGAAEPYAQAVADVCRLKGAEIFATVTNPAQREMLWSKLSIPEDQIFVESDGIPSKSIMGLTNNKGIDVIVATMAGHRALRQSWNCIAPYGRFIQLGSQDTSRSSLPFKNNTTFATIDLPSLVKERPDIVAKTWRDTMPLFHARALQGPSSVSTHSISDISDALQALRAGKHQSDKVTITVGPKDVVKATLEKRTHTLLQRDASYMLVGGLGGIGRATALWIIEHGAKNLIFVNRSGMASEAARETVKLLEQKGVNVIVRPCDISDNDQVQRMMDGLSKVAPPIRGVIQAAAVFKDTHFEQMTAEDYNRVLQPKYAGTWNLHRHLPKHLDFFIMLSSLVGVIGNATQAPYAAGSTFMDAFARYRNSLGLHAVSLDLGVITDAGYLAEANKELADKMAQQGFQGMNTKTLMSLVETAITGATIEAHSQIITGLGEWKEGRSLGSLDSPIFAQFRRQFLPDPAHSQTGDQKGAFSDATLREELKLTKSLEDASGIIYNALSTKFATHLSIAVDEVNPETPISELGIDSHVAVELRNWIAKKMESTVPILEILASGSLLELADKIAGKSSLVNVSED